MKRIFFLLALAVCACSLVNAQAPKREMRAVWTATVWRIDWPSTALSSSGGTSAQITSQKNEMLSILNSLVDNNMNAICFQVRSRCDAMYSSAYEPWSSDLGVARGTNPGYDPLAYVVEEAHKRGIEVHAWLNPYRFESASNQWSGLPGNYRSTNPSWVLTYSDGKSILDPGVPAVRTRIADIVDDIITKYDVDGIIFDDYFYAYGGTPATLDQTTQNNYKPSGMSVDDWRRKNVNDMVADVYNKIQSKKPYVTFGVSPFGIWTTSSTVASARGLTLPSGITGGNMYAEIYCDPVA